LEAQNTGRNKELCLIKEGKDRKKERKKKAKAGLKNLASCLCPAY
jgi:hypothetical protein